MSCKIIKNGARLAPKRGRSIFDNLDMSKLATVKEVAGLLNMSERTIRDWVFRKQIPFLKVKGGVRFDLAAILEWLERGCHVDQDDYIQAQRIAI